MQEINIIWFRRDLRLYDNHALSQIIKERGKNIFPLFIFDDKILDSLPADDHRVSFLYDQLEQLNSQLNQVNASIHVFRGTPSKVINNLSTQYSIKSIFANEDYESYGIQRDSEIDSFCSANQITFKLFQDHVIKKPGTVTKTDGSVYQIYTPFKKQYLKSLSAVELLDHEVELSNDIFFNGNHFPSRDELNLKESIIKVPVINHDIDDYEETRNFPALDKTSKLGMHLRFGTVSIRELFKKYQENEVFISELIWREFFIHILYFYPDSAHTCFKEKYEAVPWRNDQEAFEKWCKGETGYPMVDAGMRELNKTGFMHNRVRMVTASFLCKHLLIDWRWGEKYFAEKLFDFELASNVGNWQWAAGTGCDAAPYFRVFNPDSQHQKFDKESKYVNRWVPEWNNLDYRPIIDHSFARTRAIETYKKALAHS